MSRLCVLGPAGRMGALVVEVVAQAAAGGDGDDTPSSDDADSSLRLVSAVARPGSAIVGRAVAGVTVTDDLAAGLAEADVYIDFTIPEVTRRAAELAAEHGVAAVIGTTGLDPDAADAIGALTAVSPVISAPNFSLGVNLLLGLAERAARALDDFDLEVVEIHHRHKRDAPSGTALALAGALAAGRAPEREMHHRLTRSGEIGPRADDEIGVMTVRGGTVPGEHTAYFLGPDERLELTHRAGSRRIFAAGAVRAARWLSGQEPGQYHMRDVLGL